MIDSTDIFGEEGQRADGPVRFKDGIDHASTEASAKSSLNSPLVALVKSPFARRGYFFIEQGYSVVPIAPGTKRPGTWSKADGWKGMTDWERFGSRLASDIDQSHWERWPDAGIGLVCGKLSGVVALDRDYDAPGTDALEKIIPYSPVKKRGAKGYTAFYRYRGEPSRSFNSNGMRVLDLLSDGRQTLMPGTVHPDGMTYRYLTEDCLEEMKAEDLPYLPENFSEEVTAVLAPYQTTDDKKYQRTPRKPHIDTAGSISTRVSYSTAYFRDLNRAALEQLDAWVPKLIATAHAERDGYRSIATWRNCKKANVGIHDTGIFDFGGNYGMTPIDLVMAEHGLTFGPAAEKLCTLVDTHEPEPIIFTNQRAPRIYAVEVIDEDGVITATEAAAVLPGGTVPQTAASVLADVISAPPVTSEVSARAIPAVVLNAPGIIGRIAAWINETSPKHQPELAVAASIALCATVMQRIYRSSNANFTSLYVVMIAKSTEGKEHPMACVERVLMAANLGNLVAGSGYTSPGAVYSALLRKPSHIVIIDEMGKLLKLSRAKGAMNAEGAIDKLIEVFGKLNGVMRPSEYSTMTLTKGPLPAVERIVHNPAITLLCATTPDTFYSALTDDMIGDGFIGRLLVVESSQPRQLVRMVDQGEPPQEIIEWCINTHGELGKVHGNLVNVSNADTLAQTIPLPFEEQCHYLLKLFEEELNALKSQHEADGLDVLLGRTYEKALRLAMIAAKGTHPDDNVVRIADLQWAITYVRHYDLALLESVRTKRIRNDTDAELKRMERYIRGVTKFADKIYLPWTKKGLMPHSKLVQLMKLSAPACRVLIATAIETRTIERGELTLNGVSMVVYKLLDHG